MDVLVLWMDLVWFSPALFLEASETGMLLAGESRDAAAAPVPRPGDEAAAAAAVLVDMSQDRGGQRGQVMPVQL